MLGSLLVSRHCGTAPSCMSASVGGGLRWYHERLSVGERPAKSRGALLRLATPPGDDSDDWERTGAASPTVQAKNPMSTLKSN